MQTMSANRRPIKSLGQNFLVDRNIVDKIMVCADIGPQDRVLEIGPGRGALTERLAERAGQLVLVEYDHALAAGHAARYRDDPRVTVVDGDVLAVDLDALLGGMPGGWKVVANLPYNISSPVLFRMLDCRALFSRLVLMLQREVGERLTASAGCADYGVTTLLLGLWFDMRLEFIVPPGCFYPPPRVDSVVVSFVPLARPRVEVGSEETFRRVVKGAFAMRRKTLANCLKAAGLVGPEDLGAVLDSCGIDGQRRGETLTLEEFASLSRRIAGNGE
jgi:16S rRNA (adenine1518-N6/adenine1519-N6)-dimethyltransferase